MPIKGIIFDFDGLILDTETPKFNTWCDIYKKYGLDFSISLWAKCLGADHKAFDPLMYLLQNVKHELDPNAISEDFDQRSLELIVSQPELPGVTETLDSAQSMGLRFGLASSGDRAWVQSHLTRLDLLNRFECIYTRDDVTAVKPDPELFQRAMNHLGLRPDETIVFEDSPLGIKAARNAGCFCVAVPNNISNQLDLSQASLRVNALNQFTLPELISQLMDNTAKKN